MIKPHHTLGFLLLVGVLSFGLMYVTPPGGYNIAGVELRYPSWDNYWNSDTAQVVDVKAIIRASHMTRLDTAGNAKTEAEKRAREKLERTLELRKLQFVEGDSIRLSKFKSALEGLKNGGTLRVLHFGDSQIEGDRITSFLREEWQTEYGGEGPGMIAAVPLAPNFSIRQTYSENWKRYTAFGKQDTTIDHRRFGYRAVICRYTPPVKDSTASDTTMGWLEFQPSNLGYKHVRSYHKMVMHFGYHKTAVRLKVYANDTLLTEEIVKASQSVLHKTWRFTQTPRKVRIEFVGEDSPDVYGISFEGNSGVIADNMGMRGASGVVFTRMERSNFTSVLADDDVQLVLFQYGGNTVPYIKDEDHAKQYARRVKRQIMRLKTLLPNATFVMIGPSDMSQKNGASFATYPAVPWVNNALHQVAIDEGVIFWDLYGAMGGHNSMPQWVNANPPLAGADHIHFTPRGAREVALWLYEAFENEMNPTIAEAPQDSTINNQPIQ